MLVIICLSGSETKIHARPCGSFAIMAPVRSQMAKDTTLNHLFCGLTAVGVPLTDVSVSTTC
jgi:hypothetical protein